MSNSIGEPGWKDVNTTYFWRRYQDPILEELICISCRVYGGFLVSIVVLKAEGPKVMNRAIAVGRRDFSNIEQKASNHLLQTSRFARRVANLLVLFMFLSIIAMMVLPWQQTSRGNGQVVAFVPQERQQAIEAPVKGVIAKIAPGLLEGSQVKKGDFILEIQPFAQNLMAQLNGQLDDLRAKLKTTEVKAEAYQKNVDGFTEARDFAVSAAQQMVKSADAKLQAQKDFIQGYQAKELQARLNYQRQHNLFKEGIKSQKDVEKFKKEWDVAKADLQAGNGKVRSLENELKAKQAELEEKKRIAKTKIDYAIAMKQDALGNGATIRKEIREVEIKLAEMNRSVIRAPRDGTIFRMPVYELGQTIKQGDPILTLIPESGQKAVELLISGNDMPLIQEGQEVRIQFEGWPAVQFAGWPSVAVGTFSGKVSIIDATDNGKGRFRILVVPTSHGQAWPSDRYLRQGVRANGWVMLRQVSLGYEIWRQLNGFPVNVSEKEPKKKTPKLPKS